MHMVLFKKSKSGFNRDVVACRSVTEILKQIFPLFFSSLVLVILLLFFPLLLVGHFAGGFGLVWRQIRFLFSSCFI